MTASGGNMPRRTALPAEPNPHAEQLAERLRRLKDHGELSMRTLAAKTGYSQKSWERYLGGRSLPPRAAVEALARIRGVDPVPLLALREVAAGSRDDGREAPPSLEGPARPGVAAASDTVVTGAGGRPPVGRALRITLGAGAVALVLAVSSTVLLLERLREEGPVASPVPAAASTSAAEPVYTCRMQRIDGLWYAGISRTRAIELSYGNGGPEVAEAQCLLRRAGISPGGIDGMFGPLTQRAVRALQKRSGLVADGMIGPLTWKALRG
ncbi:peptidoglycan-binding protein [Streptomyces sp. NPDC057052]|uniref:peptidoglycan-binding protein n=1 Tax=Streptomyces sp. NPDC057052 TaxID=3346010 RepID=UPI00362E37D1